MKRKGFALKNFSALEDAIIWKYSDIKSFTIEANISYSTAYRILKGKKVEKQSALKFTAALNRTGYKKDAKSIFLIK